MPDLTPLGELLEQAREARGLSKREAARRAKISEGRWRQIVTGYQRAADVEVPVNPRPLTVVSMARAVGVDVSEALRAAGLPVSITAHAEPATGIGIAYDATVATSSDPVEALIQEIYDNPKMPEERKQELVRLIRKAEAQAEAERQAARDELNRWRSRQAAG